MTIFVVVGYTNLPELGAVVQRHYPGTQNFHLAPSTWFVVDSITAAEVSDKLDIKDGKLGAQAVVFPASSYAGWVRGDFWDWVKSKLEAKPSGT